MIATALRHLRDSKVTPLRRGAPSLLIVLVFTLCLLDAHAAPLFTPATSSHFFRWSDPQGAISYLLKNTATEQATGYFTQKMYTDDGKFLWFVARDKPDDKKPYLGLVDFRTDSVRLFREARFDPSTPIVDLHSGDCYYIEARGSKETQSGWNLNRLSPDGQSTTVNRLPRQPSEDPRDPRQITTHLTFNASHTALGFDCGNYLGTDHTYAGIIPLDGSAPIIWHIYDRRMDHAQMSPKDDSLMLLAQDYYDHTAQGQTTRRGIDNRTWLLQRDGKTWPIFADPAGAFNSHEWWDANGQDIWFTDRKGTALAAPGTGRFNINTGKATLVWPGATGVSESSASQRYLVGDNYKNWSQGKPVRLDFFDASTQQQIPIASALPPPSDRHPRQPNPHFELHDTWIAYTTSVNGQITLALAPTEPLKAAAKDRAKAAPN